MHTSIDLAAFDVKPTLSPDLWVDGRLRPQVRKKLLEIADEFLDWLDIDAPIYDIVITGSMANYNWTQYSDIDVHPLVKYADIDDDVELVRQLLMAKKSLWNEHYDITIKGHPVELYVQDVDEPHYSSGIYSIVTDEWLVKPSRDNVKVDLGAVKRKVDEVVSLIKRVIDDEECPSECINVVKNKIRAMRRAGLETGGEYSVENMAFKVLRSRGWLDRLNDVAESRLERELSLESDIR